jgi:hypothetical protein
MQLQDLSADMNQISLAIFPQSLTGHLMRRAALLVRRALDGDPAGAKRRQFSRCADDSASWFGGRNGVYRY